MKAVAAGGLALLTLIVAGVVSGHATYSVEGLRCEYLSNPLGIDVEKPRLSWLLTPGPRGRQQDAYQVLVASSQANLQRSVMATRSTMRRTWLARSRTTVAFCSRRICSTGNRSRDSRFAIHLKRKGSSRARLCGSVANAILSVVLIGPISFSGRECLCSCPGTRV
jgi:hypothetical protein